MNCLPLPQHLEAHGVRNRNSRSCNRYVLPPSPPMEASCAHMMRSFLTPFFLASLVALNACSAAAQKPQRLSVIDAHTHLDVKTGPAVMESLNVRYWVVTLHNSDLRNWAKLESMAHRYLPSLSFPFPGGRR